jgi:hypothetical protein
MGKNWAVILSAQGKAWNIPAAVVQELTALIGTADNVLAAAKNESTRTPVVTAHCREVFGRLEDAMRDIKKRYFYAPPLTEADIIALGLKPRDTTPSASGKPTAQVTVETFLTGRHELGLRIVYVTGSPEDKANKEYRIWYAVVGPGEKAPERPEELSRSFSTKREEGVVEFDYGDSGKKAYFAVQVENGGQKGPWGPLVSALIP